MEMLQGFPSPYGVIFILMRNHMDFVNQCNINSFRLLTELYSFLHQEADILMQEEDIIEFPSPYGVSFILIILYQCSNELQ